MKSISKFTSLAILALILAHEGCIRNNQNARPAVSLDTLSKFYADMLVLRYNSASPTPDSMSYLRKTDSIYSLYHIDSIKLRNTFEYMNQRPELWQTFMESVSVHIADRKSTK
jgi:hypothetical protein